MKIKVGSLIIFGISLWFLATPFASAHVIVQPKQVGIGATETFTVSVPTEKDNPTVGLRLVLPAGLEEVTPIVKSSWKIDVKKDGDKVTEINWTGGSIPPDQADQFSFRAQAPANPTDLKWKAYQTYQDGSTVNWDQDPSSASDKKDEGTPYSVTNVVNDLNSNNSKIDKTSWILGGVAIALAIISLGLSFMRKN